MKNTQLKAILLLLSLQCVQFIGYAQGDKRLKVNATFTPSKVAGEGEILVTVAIEKGFHVFSMNPGGDGSQIPTELTWPKTAGITYIGKPIEKGKLINKYEDAIEATINYYENTVSYTQKVKYTKDARITGNYYFQVCNEGMCERPTDIKIPVTLGNLQNATVDTSKKTAAIVDTVTPATINTATTSNVPDVDTVIAASDSSNSYGKYGAPVSDCGSVQQETLSPWMAFIYGILGGLAALFFPCTLPMIPMTISFFLKNKQGKQAGIRNGIFYGFSIFLVYFLLSLPFLFLGWGSNVLNSFSTNPTVNIVFFLVFIVFAFSLFGYYDISLPSSLTNKIDSKSNNSSYIGIFFMALTLAIVSFSCTGPILGLVLGNIKNAQLITPAMSGFGIGLGLPFAIFAIFPNLLKALPKSGGWLTTLKVVFGFIELGFALKFLSNADLVKQWGLLKREVFIGLWIVVLVAMALYLLGAFAIKKGERNQRTLIGNIIAGLCLLFAGYMGLDYFGYDTKLISGFPPPKFYSYSYKQEKHKNGELAKTHIVNGLTTYTNLEDAMIEAKKQNKPIMIDFTGWACVNCRRMEENVWVKPGVYELLRDKYIIASLYVDERTALSKDQQFASPYLKGMATTVGDKWFDFSLRHFRSAGQPYYALIDPRAERLLNTPVPFTPEVDKYKQFLECGLVNYKGL
jgi:thiol:disulfide interchange protein